MKKIHSIATSVATFSVLGLLFALPVFFLPAPWATIPHAKILLTIVLVLAGLLAWLTTQLLEKNITIPWSGILAASVAIPFAYLASALFTGGMDSLVGTGGEADSALAVAIWVLSLWLAALTVTSGSKAMRACQALLVSIGIIGVVHALRILAGPAVFTLGGAIAAPAASLVGSWHDLGILLGIGAILAAGLYGSGILTRGWRTLSLSVLALSLILLIILNARDIWIVLAVVAAVAAGAFWLIGRKKPAEGEEKGRFASQSVLVYGTIVLIAGIGAIATSWIAGAIPDRLNVGQIEVRPSWSGTTEIGSSVYREESALFGSGPSTFERQWGRYKPTGVNETAFWNAEFSQGVGFIPTAFVTVGLVGALAWIAFLGMIAWSGVRSILRVEAGRKAGLMLPFFAAVVFAWVMNVVYAPGTTILILTFILTGVFVGMQVAARAVATRSFALFQNWKGWVAAAIAVGALLIAILAAFFFGRALIADMLINRSVSTYNATNDFAAAEQILALAARVQPGYDRTLRAAVELNLIRFSQYATAEGIEDEARAAQLQNAISVAIQNGLSAVAVNSANYQNWLILARAYEQLVGAEVEGAYENARDAYQKSLAENPSNPEPYLSLARLAAIQGDMNAARENIAEALKRKQNYAAAHLFLSQIEVTAGNLEEARAAALKAVESAPEEPVVWFQYGALSYELGENEEAGAALERAVTLNANYANALYILGFVYYELDFTENALNAFKRVAELNPDNEAVASIVESLEEGGSIPANLMPRNGAATTEQTATQE